MAHGLGAHTGNAPDFPGSDGVAVLPVPHPDRPAAPQRRGAASVEFVGAGPTNPTLA